MIDPSQWPRWLPSDGFKIPSESLQELKIIMAIPGQPIEMEATGLLPVYGSSFAPYVSFDPGMLQQLKWHDEYRRQGKHYPRPRRCRSKARMSKEWRDRV